jgi:hypothetical protein
MKSSIVMPALRGVNGYLSVAQVRDGTFSATGAPEALPLRP